MRGITPDVDVAVLGAGTTGRYRRSPRLDEAIAAEETLREL